MNAKQTRCRRLRRQILYGVGGFLILLAAIVGGLGLLFPWLLAHPERVQSFLSERLQRPVTFASLDGEWLPGGPVFRIRELRIGDDAGHPSLVLSRAELAFDFYAPFKRGVAWHELRIVGLDIDAERDAEGRFRVVQWRGSSDAEGDPFDALQALGAFRISQSSLTFRDLGSDSRMRLQDIDVVVGARAGGQRILGRALLGAAAPVAVRCDLSEDFRSGRCYLEASDLPVANALGEVRVGGIAIAGGRADLALWAAFRHGQITEGRLELSADSLVLRGLRPVRLGNGEEIEARYSPDSTRLSLQWSRIGERERFALLEGPSLAVDEPSRSKLIFDRDRSRGTWQLAIAHLELERLMPWLALSTLLGPGTAGWIYEAGPSGDLFDLRMTGRGRDVLAISGRLDHIAIAATRISPRIQGIDAVFAGDADAVRIQIDPVETVVDFPGIFPTEIPVAIERADLVVARQDDAVRVEFPALSLQSGDFGLDGWFALVFEPEGERPFLEGVVNVRDSDVVAVKSFWPIPWIPVKARNWLIRALVSGRIRHGTVAVRGDLDDWPFKRDQGRFAADVVIEDLDLDYHREWPRGRIGEAELHFRNAGMSARARNGKVLGVTVNEIEGGIERFRDPVLRLSGHGAGRGADLLEFLRATPLDRRYQESLLALSIGGWGEVRFDLDLPLVARLGKSVLSGSVDFHDADLIDAKWGLKFERANGIVRFSREGFDTEGLMVEVDGDSARFAIAVGAHVADPANRIEASLSGVMKASSVMSAFHALDPYWNRLPGKANWNLVLTVPREAAPDRSTQAVLTLRSDLRGIALNLPAPLGKDAESPLPLQMTVGLPTAGNELDLQLGALARFKARMSEDAANFAGHLAFGGEWPELSATPGLRISGIAPSIDLIGWSTFFVGGEGTSPDLSVDLQTSELDVLGRSFADTHVRIRRDRHVTRVDLEGAGIAGYCEMPRVDLTTRGLTMQFERLHWPEADARPARPSAMTDPSRLPPLHIWVRDLKLGVASFGEARIETQPMPRGLRIERFDARSPTLTMRANGVWTVIDGVERSELDATLSSESLGKMLESLGFVGVIDGGQTVARLKGSWAGSPAKFGLANLDGELSGEVGEGRILNVEPGAGRIFGLVNFGAIPRRLALDFRDFFQTGMAFDSIRGDFALVDGNAHTGNLEIQGPAADIRIRGRTGLRARDYEQEMEVTPKLRGALPIVGAVAGGPVGAMVGVLAQGVMGKPIDEVVSSRYRVRGTWDKPDITLIGRSAPRMDPPPATDSG